VGRTSATYTCSRLVALGRLQIVGHVDAGPERRGRPAAVLALVQASAPDLAAVM